jgi:hypothetical protein
MAARAAARVGRDRFLSAGSIQLRDCRLVHFQLRGGDQFIELIYRRCAGARFKH